MESVAYLEQDMGSRSSHSIQLVLQMLKLVLQIFCLSFEDEDDGPRKKLPLREAAMSGNLTSVQLLLEAGKSPLERDKEYYTPLHWAAANGHLEVSKKLIEFDASLEHKGGLFQFTPLHMAAGEGHLEICNLLLNAGAQVNSVDIFYDTPMHWAAWFGHLPVVKFLVGRGGNHSLKNADGNKPRDMAYVRKNEDIVQWLDGLLDV